MSVVWKREVGSAVEKLVLLKLADNANDEGEAWPLQATIAAQCEVSERTVRTAIASLEYKGMLTVKKWRDGSRKGTAGNRDCYIVHPEGKPETASGSNRQGLPVQPETASGSNRKQLPVPIVQPSIEPSENPGDLAPVSPSAPEPATSPGAKAHELIKAWCEEYASTFGDRFIVDGKEAGAAKRLCKAWEPEEVIEVARIAWKGNTFNCRRAVTLSGIADVFQALRVELRRSGTKVGALKPAAVGAMTLDGERIES